MDYVIDSSRSLRALETDRALKSTIRRIRIDLGGGERLADQERRLNRHYFACGCETGSVAVLVTLVACGVAWATGVAPALVGWRNLLVTLAAAAILGKLAGLGFSRLRLRRLLRELRLYCRDGRQPHLETASSTDATARALRGASSRPGTSRPLDRLPPSHEMRAGSGRRRRGHRRDRGGNRRSTSV